MRYKNEAINSNLFHSFWYIFFFLLVQICSVRSAGSQCLLLSDMYAHAPHAAEAYTVEMRGEDALYWHDTFHGSFWHGKIWTCFGEDLFVLHVIKYYAVNISQ